MEVGVIVTRTGVGVAAPFAFINGVEIPSVLAGYLFDPHVAPGQLTALELADAIARQCS